ncbi:MAG: RNA 2',3'-cyclic phosphodiesterase [Candidatus Syntrophosphaera sp.]|nr:RNA 2',3'-cyclic phosphodiesterase [Candidatus Syntrophosphaera sp.]
MKYRSFIALEAPAQVHACLADRLAALRTVRGVNWVKEQNLHLTLLFLGDVESVLIPELEKVLDAHTARRNAFSLALKGLQLFPAKAPRLVWASLASQDDALSLWHKELLKTLRAEGFEPDAKPLRLHITLGRIKSALPADLEREIMQSAVEQGFFAYDTLTLYRSVLKPEGPTYHVLNQYKLP